MNDQEQVISVLIEERILDSKTIDELVMQCQESNKSLINVLKTSDLISQEQLARIIAVSNGIEFINLSPDMVDQIAAKLVSYDVARHHLLIPVNIEGDKLRVAMSSPLNLNVRDMLATKTGYSIVPLAATTEAVKQAITYHYNVESVTKQDIVSMRLKDSASKEHKARKTHSKSADAPIVRLVDSIITGGIDARSSDIHIEPCEPDMRVRYRVDGILVEALSVPAGAQREVISHIKILADMDISEKRIPQDGHITIEHNDKEYDLRVSSLPATGGEKIVIRILDTTTGLLGLDKIVSNPDDRARFDSLIANPYGIILLTGPTGSGKTTTLYSLIHALNKPERNIVTVEDPVEYRLNGITQVQVKSDIGMTFASSLRSILRQDPDVILIGEIRDYETAEIAISAAQTGHLVLSTLHTNDAAGAISRLVSLGIEPFQAASCLLGAVAQRLVRKNCAKCNAPYTPQPEQIELLPRELRDRQDLKLYHGTGCSDCHNTGYRGRQGVYEILPITHDIRSMIIAGASDDQIKAKAVEEGMRTLKAQGVLSVINGNTTVDEIARVVDMRED